MSGEIEMSPMSPSDDSGGGHVKPAWILTVPVVPNVPAKNGVNRDDAGEIDLLREFMVDGMTLAEARATAALSAQPRPAGEWLANGWR